MNYQFQRYLTTNAQQVMHLSSAIPWEGGTPGKYNFIWGLLGRFERSFYPTGGGNEGGLVSVSLAPRGKQGTS